MFTNVRLIHDILLYAWTNPQSSDCRDRNSNVFIACEPLTGKRMIKVTERRIDDIAVVSNEVLAWQKSRNNKNAKVNWQFTTEAARIKLSRLYPTLED
jgi:hypothetical protein